MSTRKKISEKHYDIDPVVIARGQTSSASLIGAAKIASNAKYTEERVGERTIYIFSGAQLAGSTAATNKFPGVVAVTVIDTTTLAFGSPARVRQTIEARTKVDQELIGLLGQNPSAVTSFAGRVPAGLKAFMPMDNDELGKNIDSIQYLYGNADVVGDAANLHIIARTLQNAQAKSLHETLEGLQMLGKAFLGSAKGADKQAYARMIGNARFAVRANEVIFDLQVPQSDIDILVGSLKSK